VIARLRRRVAAALDRRAAAVIAHGDRRADELTAHGDRRADALEHELRTLRFELRALHEEAMPLLRVLAAAEPAGRRALEALRASADYELAFAEPDPLVTVCIPTYDRVETLLERALPSVLAQSHEHLEVLVIGDAAPAHVGPAVEALGDPRVRFVNLTHRIEHADPEQHWAAGSVQARNAGYALARGRWLSDFDDDDALRPQAIEHALRHARERRLEFVYGRQLMHLPEGRTAPLGGWPPRMGDFSFQGSVAHAGLRWFAREHVAAALRLPNDWERAERMLRAGVRTGMLDEVVCDMWPSRAWDRLSA
jgi:hypothetical protein